MLYRNDDGRHPSLLVEDGETVTIGAKGVHDGIPVAMMRPRTTAAIMVLGGRLPSQGPRLTDRGAFERVESAEGLVNFAEVGYDGTIDGYSVPFISRILDAFDPREPVPPTSVQLRVPSDSRRKNCGCSASQGSRKLARGVTEEVAIHDRALAEAPSSTLRTRGRLSVYVPEFLVKMKVHGLFTSLGDIVVGFNATLVLDSNIAFAVADNVFAYRGSRIVQRSDYLNLDVRGILRGGILSKIHTVAEKTLRVNYTALAAERATKP